MKKFKLLTGLGTVVALSGGVAATATSCTWSNKGEDPKPTSEASVTWTNEVYPETQDLIATKLAWGALFLNSQESETTPIQWELDTSKTQTVKGDLEVLDYGIIKFTPAAEDVSEEPKEIFLLGNKEPVSIYVNIIDCYEICRPDIWPIVPSAGITLQEDKSSQSTNLATLGLMKNVEEVDFASAPVITAYCPENPPSTLTVNSFEIKLNEGKYDLWSKATSNVSASSDVYEYLILTYNVKQKGVMRHCNSNLNIIDTSPK